MKHYKTYMDRVKVDQKLHNRLLALEEPKRSFRRPAWLKYCALAACAALLIGVGVYQISRLEWHNEIVGPTGGGPFADREPVPCAAPTMAAEIEAIDLAPVDGDDIVPGMKTIPGFEVHRNVAGLDVVEYHVLPWLGYGEQNGGSPSSLAVPEDCVRRELTQDDILALVGGEQARDVLLAWEGMELSGGVFHRADGQVWVLDLWGESDSGAFSLRLSPEELPPSCTVSPTDYVTEVWGVEVAGRTGGAYGRGADREVWMPESREVALVAKGVGCRFHYYGLEGESEAVETMVSRFVRHAILEGLNLSAVTVDGAVLPDPEPAASRPAENPDIAASRPPMAAPSPSVGPAAGPVPSRSAQDGEASPSRGPAVP